MLMGLALVALLIVPAAALGWRVVVSKSRNWLLKIGAAAAAMATLVGAFVLAGSITEFRLGNWRDLLALAAASTGSLYLLLWSLRHRTNHRHRTISLIAAMIGFVPIVAALGVALLYQE